MAKSILRRDAEDAYNRIDRALKSLDSDSCEDVRKFAYVSYNKDLNLLKGYISTATSFDDYIEKYTNAVPRFEAGLAKIEYLKDNPDYVNNDDNTQCNE